MRPILIQQLKGLIDGIDNPVTNLANTAALIMQMTPKVSWAGTYLTTNESKLILGPYQGKIACNTIPFGKGVCGKAAQDQRTELVPNVNQFPGHIACDQASQSEIVTPIIRDQKLIGVIDLDSNQLSAFNANDEKILNQIAQILANGCNFDKIKI